MEPGFNVFDKWEFTEISIALTVNPILLSASRLYK